MADLDIHLPEQMERAQRPGGSNATAVMDDCREQDDARELALHDTEENILNLDKMKLVQIAKEENYTPRAGPFSAERNQEIFKAMLYLMDAEKKKRPNVVDDYDSMRWYYARKKTLWKLCLFTACLLYILVSVTELSPFRNPEVSGEGLKDWYEIVLEVICDSVFALDIYMQMRAKGYRTTWNNRWTQAFCLCLIFHFVGVLWQGLRILKVTGIVRAYPIVYYSKRARNAMINYSKTLPSVMLWIGLELFVIVLYSCVCVVLYAHLDRDGVSGQSIFQSFPSAFLNLYLLSLTVNDPDTYLPYYKHGFLNFFVFASFMIITFFMIHNIILARIFQIYSDKLRETAVKRRENRHKALFLAFEALDETKDGLLPKELLAYVLKRLRPKYSAGKIETLMRHSNKRRPHEYNFDQFEVLMTSLDDRVSKVRQTSFYLPCTQRLLDAATVAHLLIVLGSIMNYWNFFYSTGFWVLIWFFRIFFTADVVYRYRRTGALKYFLKDNFNVMNIVAVVFSLISLVAFILALTKDGGVLKLEPYTHSKKLACLAILLASCCDIGRIFIRLPEYAALLVVFKKLVPAFVGQATVVFTMMHVFCYVGMYAFGGRVDEADPMWAEKDFPGNLYYLLNFNSYKEGMVTLFCLLIVNNINLIAGNFITLTSAASYMYFMAYQITVVVIGLNCVTSFFIGNLSSKLVEELELQKDEKRRKKEEAKARRSGAVAQQEVVKFKVERRVSSDDLMLTDEEPVGAAEYRSLLDAITRETGDRTGFSFIKENADTGHPQTVQRSPFFLEIIERYGGETPMLLKVKTLFQEELDRRLAREESGAADPLQPYLVVEETLPSVEGLLLVRMFLLTDNEELLAYCQIKEMVSSSSSSSSSGSSSHESKSHGPGSAVAIAS